MKNGKGFLGIIILMLMISCGKDKTIEGVYYVNNDKTDKVYIELIDKEKGRYKVSTPSEWEEYATFKNDSLIGDWEYSKDFYDKKIAGRKGSHIAIFQKNIFEVEIFSDRNNPAGNVTWTKFKALTKKIKVDATIYLTFDDGPFDGTPNVLLALDKTNVKATFFLVGLHAEKLRKKHSSTLKELKKTKNILLANHSYSHAYGKYASFYKNADTVIDDLVRNKKSILQYESFWKRLFTSNINGDIVRLPGRNVWILDEFEYFDMPDVKNISGDLSKSNFKIYGWDIEWHMKKGNPANGFQKVVNQIDYSLKNHNTKSTNKCVILMHDRMFYSKKNRGQLINFINLLKIKGYKFETLSDY